MPLIKVKTGGWKFGAHGKRYYGKGARAKAKKQGAAIEISKIKYRYHLLAIFFLLVLFTNGVHAWSLTPISTFNGITQNSSVSLVYNFSMRSQYENQTERQTTSDFTEYFNNISVNGTINDGSFGNSFTIGSSSFNISYTLTKISISGYRIGILNKVYPLSIYATDTNGLPTGAILSSGTINGSAIAASTGYFNVSVSPLVVSPGKQYAWILNITEGNSTDYLRIDGSDIATYTGGYYLFINGSGWNVDNTLAYKFKVYGNIPYVDQLNSTIFNWNGTNYSLYDSSLVLWYQFDNRSALGENSTFITDLSGYGNNGTAYNLTWISGYGRGGTGGFNFSENYTTGGVKFISAGRVISNNSNFTASLWIYPHNFSYSDSSYVARFLGNYAVLFRWTKSSQKCFVSMYNGSDIDTTDNKMTRDVYQSHNNNCNEGSWHNMVLTYNTNNNTILFYVDGILYRQATFTNKFLSNDVSMLFGSAGINTYPNINYLSFNGSIDDVMIWNKTMTQNEVSQVYASQLTKYDPENYSLTMNESINVSSLNSTHLSDTFVYFPCISNLTSQFCLGDSNFSTRIVNSYMYSPFLSLIGRVRSDFYGTGLQSSKLVSGNLDTNCDGISETPRDLVADQADFINGGNKITYYDASLGSYYGGISNRNFEDWTNLSKGKITFTQSTGARAWNVATFNANGTVSNSTDSHSGIYSLNVTATEGDHIYTYFSDGISLKAGSVYNASIWLKGNWTGSLALKQITPLINCGTITPVINNTWRQYSVNCTATQNASGYTLIIDSINPNETVLIDDFQLTENGVPLDWWQKGDTTNFTNQITLGRQNNITQMIILDYMPDFLANWTSNCKSNISDSDTNDCFYNNESVWQSIIIDFYKRVNSGYNDTYVENWNEPYGSSFEDQLVTQSYKTDFVKLYNSSYNAIKSYNPNIKVIGYRDTSLDVFGGQLSNFTLMMMSNLSNEFDGFSFHPYYGSGYINGVHKIQDALAGIFANISYYGGNTSYISADEWQPNYATRNDSLAQSPRYSAEMAYFYNGILNSYPANVSTMYYHWDDTVSYFNCPSRYSEYPSIWSGISEAGLDNPTRTYYPPYNVTKDFANYARANSDVYASYANDSLDGVLTSSSTIGTTSKKGDNYYIIVENTLNTPRNVTIVSIPSQITSLTSSTGQSYPVVNGQANLGIVESYKIQYLNYTYGQVQDNSSNTAGLFNYKVILGIMLGFLALSALIFSIYLIMNYEEITPTVIVKVFIVLLIVIIFIAIIAGVI